MQFLNTILLLTLTSLSLAAPTQIPKRDLTLNHPASSLPQPAAGEKLKYVVLGVGTQNYTCSDAAASTTPVLVGAVAKLYDMSSLANDRFADQKITYVPPVALGAYIMNPKLLDGYLKMSGYGKQIGEHYFDSAGVPTFMMNGVDRSPKPMLKVKKLANAAAPSTAFAGVPANGAVDWLLLGDNGASVGLKSVYRVVTAGGKSTPNCEGKQGAQEVKYATEYWMYG